MALLQTHLSAGRSPSDQTDDWVVSTEYNIDMRYREETS